MRLKQVEASTFLSGTFGSINDAAWTPDGAGYTTTVPFYGTIVKTGQPVAGTSQLTLTSRQSSKEQPFYVLDSTISYVGINNKNKYVGVKGYVPNNLQSRTSLDVESITRQSDNKTFKITFPRNSLFIGANNCFTCTQLTNVGSTLRLEVDEMGTLLVFFDEGYLS